MSSSSIVHSQNNSHAHGETDSKTLFGFWLYLLTDFMMLATLFAAYLVLQNNTNGGPGGKELFCLPLVFAQTVILLVCSLTAGIANVMTYRSRIKAAVILWGLTWVLGAIFMAIGLVDFERLIESGNSWRRSAFLSAYFTLVGTHGLHIIVALLWTVVLLWPVRRGGLTNVTTRRLTCLKMFWQFLNIIWVFIFTFVYLCAGMT